MISDIGVRPVQDLARKGLSALAAASSQATSPNGVIDTVLDGIAHGPDATTAEQALASFALEASHRSLRPGSFNAACHVALQAVASGVSGPVGPVLAQYGLQAIGDVSDLRDARTIGHVTLGVIAQQSTSQSEKVLADTARDACAQPMAHASSAAAQQQALKMIQAGVSGDPEAVLARFGQVAGEGNAIPEHARSIGYVVLQAVAKNARQAPLGSLGQAAYDASGQVLTHAVGLSAQRIAYQQIAAAPTGDPAQVLAAYGRKLASVGGQDVERATLGRSVLESIATQSIQPQEQILAATAHNACTTRANDFDAVTVQNTAFDLLAAGVHGEPGVVMAQFGLAVTAATRDTANARSLGGVVLDDIAQGAREPELQKAAQRARSHAAYSFSLIDRVLGRDPDAHAVRVQRQGLEDVLRRAAAIQARHDAERDARNMGEIKKMAEALQPPPPDKPAEVKVDDQTVTIGGIKIARRKPPAAPGTPGEPDQDEPQK